MNGPGDIPLTLSSTPDTKPCSIISIIPTLGMSSCRGRAEAFARSLSSKLRVLGTQNDDDSALADNVPIMNGGALANTWIPAHENEQTVTDLQPLRNESDSFFDFDCELESPGSPVDECEYLRLIETASNTPHNSVTESGCVCVSASSSHSSADVPYFNVSNDVVDSAQTVQQQQQQQQQQQPQQKQHQQIKNKITTTTELANCVSAIKLNGNNSNEQLSNGYMEKEHEEEEIKENAKNYERDFQHKKDTMRSHNQYTNKLQSTCENGSKSETVTKTLPVTGPDVAIITSTPTPTPTSTPTPTQTTNTTAITTIINKNNNNNNNNETPSLESSENHMSRVQQQIIDELQKQSDNYKNERNEERKHLENELASNIIIKTTTGITTGATTVTHHELQHIITNGHSEDGDEVLKIELTEIETTNNASYEQPMEQNQQILTTVDDVKQPLKLNCNISSPTEEINTDPIETATTSTAIVKSLTASTQNQSHDTTDDEDDCRPQRVRRCSSLKTGKTPPGTPGRKKIVRFADVLGLDLADIKTFLDEIPTIPNSAYEDLKMLESEPPIQLGPKSDKFLMPLFQQPGGLPNFLDLVREKQVSLENAAVTDTINMTITGSVRVRNLDFHKSVHLRYTLDHWRSFADLQANYVENSCDGFSDKFTFVIFGNTLQVGQRLEIAVRFQCKGQQFWDNNYGTNYCFQCLPTSTTITQPIQPIIPVEHTPHVVGLLSPTAGDAWCSSFY